MNPLFLVENQILFHKFIAIKMLMFDYCLFGCNKKKIQFVQNKMPWTCKNKEKETKTRRNQ